MFVVTHGQRGSERFEWQSVHKVGEMWEQHKDAMEWPYWFMEGKIVRDPAGQLGQDRWWAGGTPRRTVFSHSIVRGTVRRAESHLIPEASAPNPAFPWWPARVAPCSAGPAVWIVCPGSRPSAPSTPRVFNASYRRACRRVSCECAERAYLKQSLPTPTLGRCTPPAFRISPHLEKCSRRWLPRTEVCRPRYNASAGSPPSDRWSEVLRHNARWRTPEHVQHQS
jgi:hypothetical protein